jgi:hypothetical protein
MRESVARRRGSWQQRFQRATIYGVRVSQLTSSEQSGPPDEE